MCCSNEIKVFDDGIVMKFGGFSDKLPVVYLLFYTTIQIVELCILSGSVISMWN